MPSQVSLQIAPHLSWGQCPGRVAIWAFVLPESGTDPLLPRAPVGAERHSTKYRPMTASRQKLIWRRLYRSPSSVAAGDGDRVTEPRRPLVRMTAAAHVLPRAGSTARPGPATGKRCRATLDRQRLPEARSPWLRLSPAHKDP